MTHTERFTAAEPAVHGGGVQPAIEPGSEGGSAAGRVAHRGGPQSTPSACRRHGGGNSPGGGRLAGSSGWFGSAVLMTAPGDAIPAPGTALVRAGNFSRNGATAER